MDSKQIDAAMRDRLPVIFDGIQYDRILEYVCWYNEKKQRKLSVVLQGNNWTVRAPASKVELAERRKT